MVSCVDLFCGAGGLTHGLIAAGVPVVAGVDLDEACRFPFETNNRGASFHARDVATLSGAELMSWFGESDVRVLAGCAPCQPFSSYSQRYETVGTHRWGLLTHFGRLVADTLPHIVTMENVPAVTKHSVFLDFVATLRLHGYHVWHDVVECSRFGLAQRRRRTVLLASRFGPIRIQPDGAADFRTVRDVLKGLPRLKHGAQNRLDPLHAAAGLSPLNYKRIRASKPGGSWSDWPKQLVAGCHRKSTGRSYSGVYGRMRWDEPAPTLTTQFFGYGSGRFGHPSQARALSLREGAILQGFPPTYQFLSEGDPVQFKVLGRLIGNAVPVKLARAIGQSIVGHLIEHGVTVPLKR